jgi:serine/threonine protein kinase
MPSNCGVLSVSSTDETHEFGVSCSSWRACRITSNGTVKLIDFGSSVKNADDSGEIGPTDCRIRSAESMVGTSQSLRPGEPSFSHDAYAFGVTLLQLWSGMHLQSSELGCRSPTTYTERVAVIADLLGSVRAGEFRPGSHLSEPNGAVIATGFPGPAPRLKGSLVDNILAKLVTPKHADRLTDSAAVEKELLEHLKRALPSHSGPAKGGGQILPDELVQDGALLVITNSALPHCSTPPSAERA